MDDQSTPLRINAYVLAADPAWIRQSIEAYYPLINRLVVAYDSRSQGWTGKPIAVQQCLDLINAIDVDHKVDLLPGEFFRPGEDSMGLDTAQRQAALDRASVGADWVLQLDTDERLGDPSALVAQMEATAPEVVGIEWPMQVLYRQLSENRFLAVTQVGGRLHAEYPGSVAARAGARLKESRKVVGPFLRVVLEGDDRSLQVSRPEGPDEQRIQGLPLSAAILHNSWGRTPAATRAKVRSWGHSSPKVRRYYWMVWLPSPLTWRLLRNIHPFSNGLWMRLAPITIDLPSGRAPSSDGRDPGGRRTP